MKNDHKQGWVDFAVLEREKYYTVQNLTQTRTDNFWVLPFPYRSGTGLPFSVKNEKKKKKL